MQLLNQSRQNLNNDYSKHLSKILSRKVSPPGCGGIESITALGYSSSSPISNFYCKGYQNHQKYSFDNINGNGKK
jgi:hypothetical protein